MLSSEKDIFKTLTNLLIKKAFFYDIFKKYVVTWPQSGGTPSYILKENIKNFNKGNLLEFGKGDLVKSESIYC